MKKFLKLCATFTLLGALFVGCIDNELSPGIKELREAKAAYILAKAAVETAQVKVVEAEAIYRLALAEVAKSKAKFIDAKTAQQAAETERYKVWTEYDRALVGYLKDSLAKRVAVLDKQIELEKAQYVTLIELEAAKLWNAKRMAKIAEYSYINELEVLTKWLFDQQLARQSEYRDQLVNVMGSMRLVIVARDMARDEVIRWTVRGYFYENVDVARIMDELDHAIELADLELAYATDMYNMWKEIKDLGIAAYKAKAPEYMTLMTDLEKRKVELNTTLAQEKLKQADLQADKDLALNNRDYAGKATINIPNVLNGGSDLFNTDPYTTAAPPAAPPAASTTYYSGASRGTYGLRVDNMDNTTLASVAAAIRRQILPKDINVINEQRIFQGVEGIQQAADILAKRKKDAEAAEAAYTKGLTNWKKLYANGNDLANAERLAWATKKAEYEIAAATYKALYGSDLKFENDTPVLDPAKFTGVNYTYQVQKYLIEQYVFAVKTLLSGGTLGDFSLEQKQISDVLGGIYFNPGELVELVFGNANYQVINKVFNTIQTIAVCYDTVEMLKQLMPAYYTLSANYQGAVYKQPIMQKYNITSSVEYHAWLLLYILFESNQIKIGDDIIVIGSGYTDVNTKLEDDFLGFHDAVYPGAYSFVAKREPVPATDLVASARISKASTTTTEDQAKAYEYKFAVPSTLLAAEQALQKAWAAWGKIATDLTKQEADLFGEYARTWNYANYKVDTKNTSGAIIEVPYYTTDVPAKASISAPLLTGTEGGNNAPFNFRPELVDPNLHPSLVDGVDLYWGQPQDPANADRSYPAIIAKRTALVAVKWADWTKMGRPVYNDDPVLWMNLNHVWDNNASFPTNGNSNATTPTILLAKAMITARNYAQFQFWYDNQDAYKDLVTQLQAELDKANTTYGELNAIYTTANTALTAQTNKVSAMESEISYIDARYASYNAIYDFLYYTVAVDNWDLYDAAFDAYEAAKKQYDGAVANKNVFMTYDVHNDYDNPNRFGTFVDSMRAKVATELARYNNLVEQLDIQYAVLESQKTALMGKLGIVFGI